MAERLTDGIAMAILASLSTLAYGYKGAMSCRRLWGANGGYYFVASIVPSDIYGTPGGEKEVLAEVCAFLLEFQERPPALYAARPAVCCGHRGLSPGGFEGAVIFLAVKAFGGEISFLGSVFVVLLSPSWGPCLCPAVWGCCRRQHPGPVALDRSGQGDGGRHHADYKVLYTVAGGRGSASWVCT